MDTREMNRRMLPVLALLLLPSFTQAAGDAPLDRATLRGVKSVHIVIDVVDAELQKLGITQTALQSRLGGRLKAANVPVDPDSAEFIGFRITSVRASRGPLALSLTIGLYQPVLLSRDHEVRTSTQTWEVETVLMADAKIIQKACDDSVDELADRFVLAYRSVNPA